MPQLPHAPSEDLTLPQSSQSQRLIRRNDITVQCWLSYSVCPGDESTLCRRGLQVSHGAEHPQSLEPEEAVESTKKTSAKRHLALVQSLRSQLFFTLA